MGTETSRSTRIAIPPPVILGVPLGLGILLQWWLPLRFPVTRWEGVAFGAFLGIPAIALIVTAHMAFRRAHTTLLPSGKVRILITSGPFRLTRNPLYLGLVLLYAGIALVFRMGWPLIFIPGVIAGLHGFAILPEERRLEMQFGDEYLAYRNRVRRWL